MIQAQERAVQADEVATRWRTLLQITMMKAHVSSHEHVSSMERLFNIFGVLRSVGSVSFGSSQLTAVVSTTPTH